MTISVEIDDELDNWLDRVSEEDGITKEEVAQNLLWQAYMDATSKE